MDISLKEDILAMLSVAKDRYYYSLGEDDFSKEIEKLDSEYLTKYYCLQKSIGRDSFVWEVEKKLDLLASTADFHNILKDYDFSESNSILMSILTRELDIKTLRMIYHRLNAVAIYEEYGSLDKAKEDEDIYEDVCILTRIENIVKNGDFLDSLPADEEDVFSVSRKDIGIIGNQINDKLFKE